MNRPQIVQALKDHRVTLARIEKLKIEILDVERQRPGYIVEEPCDALSQLQSPQITGMPRGGGISKPTENIALGKQTHEVLIPEAVVERKQAELFRLMQRANAISIMLTSLSDKEHFIVNTHLIGGRSWAETGLKHREEYGAFLSARRGKDIQFQALVKMEEACPKA